MLVLFDAPDGHGLASYFWQLVLIDACMVLCSLPTNGTLMLMMRTVWFDTSGTGRLMLVLLVLLAFKAPGNSQLVLMMRTVWSDTSGAWRLMLVLLVILAVKAQKKWHADAHDV